MFNKNFYPTPMTIAEKMFNSIAELNPYMNFEYVLEPSAGKGDLIKNFFALLETDYKYKYKNLFKNVEVIELEPELRAILKEDKRLRIVGDDFLTYNSYTNYDLIIANPPFDDGAKHLLKMIDMQSRSGGIICCLLNSETVTNLYTNERKELSNKLEELNAKIEYIENGFKDAERKTNVTVAIITIQQEPKIEKSILLDDLTMAADNFEDNTQKFNELTENDLIKSMVNQFDFEVKTGLKFIDEYNSLKNFIPTLSLSLFSNNELTKNNFMRDVRGKYWNNLVQNPQFTKNLTNNLRTELYNLSHELVNYDFTESNIYQVKQDLISKMVKGVEDTILDLFEEFTNKYSYYDDCKKNIHYYNGWKTNKAYIINKKVILPIDVFDYSYFTNKKEFSTYRGNVIGKISDLEKTLSYLDGGVCDNYYYVQQRIERVKETKEYKNIGFKYFNVTFYKKGTMHIEFTNLELLKKLNIFGSQKKGWLPQNYGKKTYSDMTNEEKEVINSFEGEKSYNDTLKNSKYYLNVKPLVQIESN